MNTRRLVWVAASLSGYCSVLLSGLAVAHDGDKPGNVNFSISCIAEAQPNFNRAVAMLHSFWFPQALNAFSEIAKAYPDCAMAYWGMAMSARTNPLLGSQPAPAMQRGADEINKAMAAGAKTEREREYIAALAVYYTDLAKGDYPARVLAYKRPWSALPRVIPMILRLRPSTRSR